MPLLPLRPLSVNDAHGGPFVIRVEMRVASASIYVRRESDKKTWSCKVNSIQEILAPTQQARELDLVSVVTCLYHGMGYDTSSVDAFGESSSLELTRREVAFFQPESWTDDNYRLTTRISIRSVATAAVTAATATATAAAASVPHADHQPVDPSHAAAIPIVELPDDDIVFGFNFAPSTASIDLKPDDASAVERHTASLQLLGAAFPHSPFNWVESPNREFVRAVKDGVMVKFDVYLEATLDILHAKGPALFVVSVGAAMVKPSNSWTYESSPGSALYRTVLQFSAVQVRAKSILRVVVLPGSMPAFAGTTLSLREMARFAD